MFAHVYFPGAYFPGVYFPLEATSSTATLIPSTAEALVGNTIQVTASGGPGHVLDRVALYRVGTPDYIDYAAIVLGDTPVAYWRLGEPLGSATIVDASGHGYVGTVNGTVIFGQPGLQQDNDTAAAFSGIDGNGVTLDTPTPVSAHFTVEAWVKRIGDSTSSSAYEYIWSSGLIVNNAVEVALFDAGATTTLQFFINFTTLTPGWIDTGYVVTDGEWFHVAVTWDGVRVIVYVNGNAVYSSAAFTGLTLYSVGSTSGTRGIGSTEGLAGPIWGILDEVALYDYALSSGQINEHLGAVVPQMVSWQYMNGTQTPPAIGLTDATLSFVMAYGGFFEFRWLFAGGWSRIATSITVSVHWTSGVVEMEFNGRGGGWTPVTDWMRNPGITWHRGLPGTNITDLVADIGTLHLTLDNSDRNSAGLMGYYSPDNVNCRKGFDLYIGLRYTVAGSRRFTGTISAIDVVPGTKGSRRVAVEAESWMGTASRTRLSGLIGVLVNNRGDQVFQAIIDSLTPSTKPLAVEKDVSSDIFPYTLDRVRDEQTLLRDEIYRLCLSGLDKCWERGDGTVVYESRSRRVTTSSSADNFPDNHGFTPTRDRNGIVNQVQSTVHPRLPSAVSVVMYSLNQPLSLVPGTPITVLGGWNDPANPNVRLGAVNLDALVATTDYTANSLADGSGTDLTSLLVVTTGLSGNATTFTITLGGATPGFLTKLQQRGKPLYDYGPVVMTYDNPASIDKSGMAFMSLDMAYQADPRFGLEAAQYVIFTLSGLQTKVSGFRRTYGFLNVAEMARTVAREVSDRITITDELTGLSKIFFINAIDEMEVEGLLTTEWLLTPADNTAFWLLEVVGRSELDATTRLGFGLIVGHTDVLHGDIHTDVAHADSVHQDSHTDAHADVSHGDDTGHTDIPHTDTPHTDTHSDVAHGDSHSDVAHVDSTQTAGYGDYHEDEAATGFHSDYWTASPVTHGDGDGSSHQDIHQDVTVPFSHNDVAHSDVAHSDSPHTDSRVIVNHVDSAHGDATGHTDTGHIDTHGDVNHADVLHQDAPHDDTHTDAAHGDIN
jgi:hypothetical protein